MLLDPILARSFHLDTPYPGIYLLLCFHRGKIKNRRNLKRAAQHCNIPDPLSLPIPELVLHLKACKKECTICQEHGKHFHWKHLNNQLRIAQEQEDKEAFSKISAIIQREQQHNF